MEKNALLIIDPQNDFCDPKGSLYVPGAEQDMQRLAEWILKNKKHIDFIAITLDSHQPNDISHPLFWKDKEGFFPEPFTAISSQDVENGKWTPRFEPERCLTYLKELEAQGEYPHVIWPLHCLEGSEGAAIFPPLFEAMVQWAETGKFYHTVQKGKYPFSEHFGAFRANIPDPNVPETQLNTELLKDLAGYENIYLAGEAKSHCVANSLKQVLDEAPDLAKRFVVIEDAMSNVTGFETLGDTVYERAKKMGVNFMRIEN